MTTLCIEAYNQNEKDSRQRDLWIEWHNAYLNRVTKMPSLGELLKPLEPEPPEPEKPQAGLDDVGRDLMNALLGHFRPTFENDPPKDILKEE